MKVKVLNQTHPGYNRERLARLEGLYCGGEEWREQLAYWLPKNTAEPEDLYRERHQRAVYHNHAGPITDLIVAWLFAEPPTVEGLEPGWLLDVDRRGTNWAPFWREVLGRALRDRQVFVWMNLPARPADLQVQTRADEERLGLLRPYLVLLEAEEVLDWGEDEAGALTWVLVKQQTATRSGPDAERVRGCRWLYIDATQIRTWTWMATKDRATPAPEDDATEQPAIQHGLGRLPVVRLQLPEGLWVMGKLHDPAVALLRAGNDLDWALHRGAHALMTVTTKDGFTSAPTLAPGYYLPLNRDADGEDKVGYAEPAGSTYDALAKRIVDLREELYRVVHAMALAASPGSAQPQSGESKARDWQAMEVVLSAYAGIGLEAMRQVAALVAEVRRIDPTELQVQGLDGWQQEDLDTLLGQIKKVLEIKIPSQTLARHLYKRAARRVLPDASAEVLEAIQKEIDAAADESASKPVAGDKLADTAFTGIQTEKLINILGAVSAGTMSSEVAKLVMLEAFPSITDEQAVKMLERARAFKPPAAPAPPPTV